MYISRNVHPHRSHALGIGALNALQLSLFLVLGAIASLVVVTVFSMHSLGRRLLHR